jgi:signal-transduction protein with cAMP-binding, CBS, and nucleotidyltransferase domain
LKKEPSRIPVKEFMTKSILSIGSSATAKEAAKKMESSDVGSIIILEKNIPVGIITERDFALKMVANGLNYDTTVKEIMSSPIISVTSDKPVLEVATLMSKEKKRRIPIIDGTDVRGIITATDLLNIFTLCTEEDMKKIYYNFLSKIYDHSIPTI